MAAFFFPDVMVSCVPRDQGGRQFLERPALILEVLSDSTAAIDGGDKLAAYRTLPSLQGYVLGNIPARRVEGFGQTSKGNWMFHDSRAGSGDCPFHALDMSLPFDVIVESLVVEAERGVGR